MANEELEGVKQAPCELCGKPVADINIVPDGEIAPVRFRIHHLDGSTREFTFCSREHAVWYVRVAPPNEQEYRDRASVYVGLTGEDYRRPS